MSWPSTITTFTNPTPAQKLNSPSHSSIETAQNTGLTEVQTFLGTMTASALGTLIGTIYNPSSDGGGHVQSANKGGTGQTAYAKGDILVATSASVLTKLSVGLDGQVLAANSSVASGINWSSATTFSNKIAVSTTPVTAGSSVAANTDSSFLSVVIPGSTLGTSNAIKATVFVTSAQANLANTSVLLSTKFGSNLTSSILIKGTISPSLLGKFECFVSGGGSSTLQTTNSYINLQQKAQSFSIAGPISSVISGYVFGTSSVNSMADQNLVMNIRFPDNSPNNEFVTNGYIVEKIS